MNAAAALLADLESAGVHLSLAGNDLHYRTRPGVSIAPFRDRITDHKPALLMELLKAEIVAALDVEPLDFDRLAYQHLVARWHALESHSLALDREIHGG